MNDLRVYGVAHKEYERFLDTGEALATNYDVGTGYDLRWTYSTLQNDLDGLYQESYMAGQVVQVVMDEDLEAEGIMLLKDAKGTIEVVSAGTSVLGTLAGLYVFPEFLDETEDVVVTSTEELREFVQTLEDTRHDIQKESLAVALPLDMRPVAAKVGIRISPFSLPHGSAIDPETAYYEVPPDLASHVVFTDPDGPFLADKNAFATFNDLLTERAMEDGDFDNDRWDIAEDVLREMAISNPAHYRRVQLAVAGDSKFSFMLGDKEPRLVDVASVRRVAGWFIGYSLYDEGDKGTDSTPEVYAAISHDTELKEVELIPLSKVIDGELEVKTFAEINLGLFRIPHEMFYSALKKQIDDQPYSYQEVLRVAGAIIEQLNDGTGVDLNYYMTNELLIQLSRDADYELAWVDDGALLTDDDAIELRGSVEGEFKVGEGYSLPCNLIGYIANTDMIDDDSTDPLDIKDVQLMAVLQPSPMSAFRYCLGNVVLVPVESIVNSRFRLSDHLNS